MLWDNRSLLVVTHEEEAKNTLRSIVTPIVCPRTWAENGYVAVTATAVRMIYYSRHTHEEEAKKRTAVDCDTDRVPANMVRKRLCSSDCYSSTYDILQQTHTRGGGKKTHRGRL